LSAHDLVTSEDIHAALHVVTITLLAVVLRVLYGLRARL
jgi:hypothetical protein